jgi:hypothetical protein
MRSDSRQRTADSGWSLRSTAVAICYLLSAISVHACPVCFGNPDSPLTKGTSNGILFLLGIIGLVQIGFVALFVTFWRRARAIRRRRESFHLIEGGAH